MAIAIDGKLFEDEWDYTMSQLDPKIIPPITEVEGKPSQDNLKAVEPEKVTEKTRPDYVKQDVEPSALFGANRYITWPERMAKDLVHSFQQTMDIASGTAYLPGLYDEPMLMSESGQMIDPKEAFRQNAQAVKDVGGFITLAPAPIVSKAVDGTLGSIAGVSAKTANKDTLKLAQEQLANKRDPELIWKDTGWFKGQDGQWKHEINARQANVTTLFDNHFKDIIDANKKGMPAEDNLIAAKLPEYLDFPELFKAYPELKNVEVQLDPMLTTLGVFVHREGFNVIALNPVSISTYHDTAQNILLHEVQHWIQRKEGFSPGSNPQAALGAATHFLEMRWREAYNAGDKDKELKILKIWNTIKEDPKVFGMNHISDVLYRRNPGEVEAQLVPQRARWPSKINAPNSPSLVERILGVDPRKVESPAKTIERGSEEGFLPKPLPMDPYKYKYVPFTR